MSNPDPLKEATDRLRAAERAVAAAESELIDARRQYADARRTSPYWKALRAVNHPSISQEKK